MDKSQTNSSARTLTQVLWGILWSQYQRHDTRQVEKTLEMLVAIGDAFQDIPTAKMRAPESSAQPSSVTTVRSQVSSASRSSPPCSRPPTRKL